MRDLVSRIGATSLLLLLLACSVARAGDRADGYRGIWYMNQPQADEYRYKYSGGFATYPQQHIPIAIYSGKANKTFFCYGGRGDDPKRLQDMVSFFDHATGEVPRPVMLLERPTNDAHCNPTLSLDDAGHVYVFCNAHGAGAPAYVFRSREPWSIDAFERVREENFSYSQVWPVRGKGLLWLHTRYEAGRRRLFVATSDVDGRTWSKPRPLMNIGMGSYQISGSDGSRVATATDYHPKPGGLNARTNLYYLETRDFGATWTTITGEKLVLPLAEVKNAALVRDFAAEGLLVYLKDLTFDADGRPVLLYLTAKGYASGPAGGPRMLHTARWSGSEWVYRDVVSVDHNYDHGSLYIESDGLWRIIAPTEPGPQPHTTGGQIAVLVSKDQGVTWSKVRAFDVPGGRNQTYARRPVNAQPGFYALWADGDALRPSESDLFYCDRDGAIFRFPRTMPAERARPERVGP